MNKVARRLAVLSARIAALVFAGSAANVLAQGSVNIYNWSDYIAEDTIGNFQDRTGISRWIKACWATSTIWTR